MKAFVEAHAKAPLLVRALLIPTTLRAVEAFCFRASPLQIGSCRFCRNAVAWIKFSNEPDPSALALQTEPACGIDVSCLKGVALQALFMVNLR